MNQNNWYEIKEARTLGNIFASRIDLRKKNGSEENLSSELTNLSLY